MKELNKIDDITTLRTDKKGLIAFLKDRDIILDMVENGFIKKDKLFLDLVKWMDEDSADNYLNKNKKFELEFNL
jgi:hypothetical protein